ncbi:MAG: hypothetical protein CL917_11580, partial [Deltaproteobacteria bacterium]|nr:hypothetical protein [Deltaproteobacteria bacterium]
MRRQVGEARPALSKGLEALYTSASISEANGTARARPSKEALAQERSNRLGELDAFDDDRWRHAA